LESRKYMILSAALFAFLLVLLIIVAFMLTSVRSNELSENDYDSLDLATIAPGEYYGEESAGLIKVKVKVILRDYEIKAIEIISHRQGRGKAAETITEEMVRENSLSVDAVSGATHSSEVIKAAVFNALSE